VLDQLFYFPCRAARTRSREGARALIACFMRRRAANQGTCWRQSSAARSRYVRIRNRMGEKGHWAGFVRPHPVLERWVGGADRQRRHLTPRRGAVEGFPLVERGDARQTSVSVEVQ